MKQKIILSLNEDELNQFRSFVKESQIKELIELVKLVTEKDDADAFIKRRVFEVLSDRSGIEIESLNESLELKNDLGLTLYHKKSLKIPFQRIVSEMKSTKIITVRECEKLQIVSNCISLIRSKI